jgi:hypothetical protein
MIISFVTTGVPLSQIPPPWPLTINSGASSASHSGVCGDSSESSDGSDSDDSGDSASGDSGDSGDGARSRFKIHELMNNPIVVTMVTMTCGDNASMLTMVTVVTVATCRITGIKPRHRPTRSLYVCVFMVMHASPKCDKSKHAMFHSNETSLGLNVVHLTSFKNKLIMLVLTNNGTLSPTAGNSFLFHQIRCVSIRRQYKVRQYRVYSFGSRFWDRYFC